MGTAVEDRRVNAGGDCRFIALQSLIVEKLQLGRQLQIRNYYD